MKCTLQLRRKRACCESSYVPDALRLLFLSFPNPPTLALLFLPLLRGFSKAYCTFSLLLSPPIALIFSLSPPFPLSAFSYFRRPLSFPRFPRAQPRCRTVASVPSCLISDRRRSHARRTACVPWEPFAPLFPRLLHFSHGP